VRVLLTGGGTGGHIYPALAIAKYLQRKEKQVEILYVGTERGLESDIVPRSGFTFRTIEVSGLKRSLSFDTIKTFWKLTKGIRQAHSIIREFKPDIVIGTGGYVCAPVLFVARLMGHLTVIHEQNVYPGLTNRFLSRFVHRVCISFADAEKYLSKYKQKVILTGNPRASEVIQVDKDSAHRAGTELGLDRKLKTVVVVSGSRGAKPINEAVMNMLEEVARQDVFQLLYITGKVHYDEIMKRVRDKKLDKARTILIRPFVYEMPELLSQTDLLIGRAGASTIAELTAMGVPAVFIPSPYVTANHQELNARWVVEHGGGVMIRESELTGKRLFDTVFSLVSNPQQLAAMSESSRTLGMPDALENIYQVMKELLTVTKT
jgi:UDP-N-acetylglucosamine--N-acetylmuramyl-(pentapeptide) pyrophosphoryl-undecaprenol N-acetylglucosamine transferase